jgi:ABC-type glutathione transport system ATPase component
VAEPAWPATEESRASRNELIVSSTSSSLSDEVIVLNGGRVVEQGPALEVMSEEYGSWKTIWTCVRYLRRARPRSAPTA